MQAAKLAHKTVAEVGVGAPLVIPPINIQEFDITLRSDSSLISHRWSEKAKKEMRDKQTKQPKTARAAKVAEDEVRASLYELPDGKNGEKRFGFPTVAFKSSAVDACSHVEGITKVEARGAFHINGELAEIIGEPTGREDMVRIGMGTADLRYRGEFKSWKTTFTIRYNKNVLSMEQIANLFRTAGFAIGVGEWRPEKNGSHGMFSVEAVTG
jgi:hypothetical protein